MIERVDFSKHLYLNGLLGYIKLIRGFRINYIRNFHFLKGFCAITLGDLTRNGRRSQYCQTPTKYQYHTL